jgi:hypothetical protein
MHLLHNILIFRHSREKEKPKELGPDSASHAWADSAVMAHKN